MKRRESMDFKDWRKFIPEVTGSLVKMRQKAYSDGSIKAKHKFLMALGMAITAKCEPCIKAYVDKAKAADVSADELKELLEVAVAFSGCVGEQWAIKAWKYWNNDNDKETNVNMNECC